MCVPQQLAITSAIHEVSFEGRHRKKMHIHINVKRLHLVYSTPFSPSQWENYKHELFETFNTENGKVTHYTVFKIAKFARH